MLRHQQVCRPSLDAGMEVAERARNPEVESGMARTEHGRLSATFLPLV